MYSALDDATGQRRGPYDLEAVANAAAEATTRDTGHATRVQESTDGGRTWRDSGYYVDAKAGPRPTAGPGVLDLGPVSVDLQRLTVPELARMLQALQAEIRRRHTEPQRAARDRG